MIYYNYDSFKNNPNASILKYFDKKFSFDKKDAIYKINFRPLFFSNEYEEIRKFSRILSLSRCLLGHCTY